jgi:hypothetical protein
MRVGPVPVATLSAGIAVALLSGCRGRASPEDCTAMSEHYLDLAVKESPASTTRTPAEVAAVREVERGLKRAVPAYRLVQDHCEAVTRAEVSCASGAETTRAWEACVHPSDAR